MLKSVGMIYINGGFSRKAIDGPIRFPNVPSHGLDFIGRDDPNRTRLKLLDSIQEATKGIKDFDFLYRD